MENKYLPLNYYFNFNCTVAVVVLQELVLESVMAVVKVVRLTEHTHTHIFDIYDEH